MWLTISHFISFLFVPLVWWLVYTEKWNMQRIHRFLCQSSSDAFSKARFKSIRKQIISWYSLQCFRLFGRMNFQFKEIAWLWNVGFFQPVFCCLIEQRWVNFKAITINHNKSTGLYVPRGIRAFFPQPCSCWEPISHAVIIVLHLCVPIFCVDNILIIFSGNVKMKEENWLFTILLSIPTCVLFCFVF